MPTYEYEAIDKNGKGTTGRIEAANESDAIRAVRAMGYFPTRVALFKGKAALKKEADAEVRGGRFNILARLRASKIKQKDIIVLTRQLATLVGAGLPLVRSLGVLHDQLKYGRLKDVLQDMSSQVSSGSSFSDALLKYPNVFSNLYVNTVRAGEATGVLEVVLHRLSDFLEKSYQTARKIKAALVYPILVVCVSLAVLLFLILFVIPRFMDLFNEVGAALPLPTLILLKITNLILHKWYLLVLAPVGLGIAWRVIYKIPMAHYYIDKFKLKIPILGQLIQKIAIARFSRTLGTLISSGVPILQALLIAKDTSDNEVIKKSIEMVHDSIREGETVARPLAASGIFPAMVVSMIDVGEESGTLDQMLVKIADAYEDDVDHTVTALTSLLEPFLLITMGGIVGFIVVAMFLPLIKLLSALSA